MAKSRLKTRRSGPTTRYYGDFRDFKDVGGGYEALIPPGATRGTTDPVIAGRLLDERLKALRKLRKVREEGEVAAPRLLEVAVAEYLEDRASPDMTDSEILTLTNIEHRLAHAIEFFGARTVVSEISTGRARRWMKELQVTESIRTHRQLAPGTVRKYLDAFSKFWNWMAQYEAVDRAANPIAGILDKPTTTTEEAAFLEVPEAALVLEAARLFIHERPDQASVPAYVLIACNLLTGGRKAEVLELTPARFDFAGRRVTLRNSKLSRRSRRTRFRMVPLWPQLEEIIRPYMEERGLGHEDLLFPARGEPDRPIQEPRKTLRAVLEDADVPSDVPPTKVYRHTYCTARIQQVLPVWKGESPPIQIESVAKELGHGGSNLVRTVYLHQPRYHHHGDEVEFRAEQWKDHPDFKERFDRLYALHAERTEALKSD